MDADKPWETVALSRLRAGDESALAEIYDQYAGYVLALARRVTRDHTAAEDVAQEVFCQLWERPDRVDPSRGTLRTYLGVLAHRRAVDLVRRTQRARARDVADCSHRTLLPDVAEEVDAHLAAAEVRNAVASLPDTQRRPVLLAYFEGYTFRELAGVLGLPEGTAKSRIRLGLEKLHAALVHEARPSAAGHVPGRVTPNRSLT